MEKRRLENGHEVSVPAANGRVMVTTDSNKHLQRVEITIGCSKVLVLQGKVLVFSDKEAELPSSYVTYEAA